MEPEEVENLVRKYLKEQDVSLMDAFMMAFTSFALLTKYISGKNLDPEDLLNFLEEKHPKSLPTLLFMVDMRVHFARNNNNFLCQNGTSEKRSEPSQETTASD